MCCCSKGREKVEGMSTGGWTRKQPRTDSVWAGTQADKAGSESMQRVIIRVDGRTLLGYHFEL